MIVGPATAASAAVLVCWLGLFCALGFQVELDDVDGGERARAVLLAVMGSVALVLFGVYVAPASL